MHLSILPLLFKTVQSSFMCELKKGPTDRSGMHFTLRENNLGVTSYRAQVSFLTLNLNLVMMIKIICTLYWIYLGKPC